MIYFLPKLSKSFYCLSGGKKSSYLGAVFIIYTDGAIV